MTPERWRKIDELYDAALQQAPELRAAFIADATQGNEELRQEIQSLLAADSADEGQLDRPAWEGATALLDDSTTAPLAAGIRLGPYEIVAPLGTGGMGEVYRAMDWKLNREVAVKILPKTLAGYPERTERLKREARVLAALNHPNIAAVYDLHELDGTWFVVLELIPGKTLASLLERGALEIREALTICMQIAEALEAAHDKGIIHRDLKPSNVMVTPEGRVKLLDFGIAKGSLDPDGGTDENPRTDLTKAGAVLGTLSYMSPEQARGLAVDKRSDIWSFACLLYEAMTGRRLFPGPTSSDTLAAILRDDPKLDDLPQGTTHSLRRLLRRCLQRDPAQRLRDIGDARIEINDILRPPAEGALDNSIPTPVLKRPRKTASILAGAVVLAGGYFGVTRIFQMVRAPVPTYHRLTFRVGTITSGRFSPDGQTIVYSSAWDGKAVELFEVRPDGPESRRLLLPSGGLLAISKTGELAMTIGCEFNWGECQGTLARVPMAGGAPHPVLENVYFADWSPDGRLAVVRPVDGRYRLEFPIRKALFETTGWISNPRFSPNGKQIAFIEHPWLGDLEGSVAVVDLSGKKTVLTGRAPELLGLAWWPSGEEIWYTGGIGSLELRAVTLSGRDRLVTRSPSALHLDDIAPDGRVLIDHGGARARMIFSSGKEGSRELSWFHWSTAADLSPDGTVILFNEWSLDTGKPASVYLRKTDGSDAVRLGEGKGLALSRDGRYALALQGNSPQRLVVLPTGTGEQRTLPGGGIVEYRAATWFPDGRRILFVAEQQDQVPRSYIQTIDGGSPLPIAIDGMMGMLVSPDGKQMAAVGPDGGFYLCPIDEGFPSAIRGMEPEDTLIQWSGDGRRLFVRAAGDAAVRIFRIDLESGKRELWRELPVPDPIGSIGLSSEPRAVHITPDGKFSAYTYWILTGELHLAEGLR